MSRNLGTHVLNRLHRRRRPLAWFVSALVVASLLGALGQCLTMGSMFRVGALSADTPVLPALPGEMPCADCTAGGEVGSIDQHPANPPAKSKPVVLALVLLSSLLALVCPKIIPIPRRPFLPTRPRTLKFCVLRI